MKFKEYISTHQTFTTSDLLKNADSIDAAKKQLKLAERSGSVERVRRGLYVSNVGRYEGIEVDPYRVITALDPNAVLSFHSALEAHGVAHNISTQCQFRSKVVLSKFGYKGIEYTPLPQEEVSKQRIRGDAFGSVFITSREQTILDVLKYPERSGGIEEAVRSISAFPYIDADTLLVLSQRESASLCARIGWLLSAKAERWHVSDCILAELSARSSGVVSKLDKRSVNTQGWSKEWNMRLPEAEEEVLSWIA